MVRALALLVAIGHVAHAGDLCAPGAKHHGKVIDLDVTHADIRDVLRLLADTANVNLVVADDVTGQVTLKLVRAPWDAVACAIAGVEHLHVTVEDGILLVRKAPR